MMLSISAPVFDPSGHIVIDSGPETDWGSTTRRVNRAATLDESGVSIGDRGHFNSDRTIVAIWAPRGGEYDDVNRMVRLYPRLILSCHLGAFDVAPRSLRWSDGNLELELLFVRRIDEEA
jgi:hypothetical protein